jgi:pyruvate/2-oxoglutarate dehydrogenase complex dihydrolipoamide dehydrogenase (E3) component/uncharacterized membrane protein YdjX (TVP38/TMEM64 family)
VTSTPRTGRARRKLLLLALLAGAVAAFFALDLDDALSLELFQAQRQAIEAYLAAHPARAGLAYFLLYIAITALSLPGAAILTLIGGALFGLLWGTVIVSFASTIGATLAFLIARYLLRDPVQRRFARHLRSVNAGIEREGAYYLFALRLVPLFPFFVINLVMGLTPMRAFTFYWVSQAGMLPGTLLYVYAGAALAGIESLRGILSPEIVVAFTLLGVFPLIAKKTLDALRARRLLRRWRGRRPRRFDYNLVVIGAGSAGLVAAYIAAAVKAKVALIEKHRMGGDCLNTGCVPSKALIRSAKFLARIRRAREFGIKSARAEFDFAGVMARVREIIARIEPHDSIERYRRLGVDCIQGKAEFATPWTVTVNGRELSARAIVIAAGAEPLVPHIMGIDGCPCYTSETIWQLRELPARLVVLGGGPVGCELAQCFARFGSRVTVIEMLDRLLPREDPDIGETIRQQFAAEGIEVCAEHKAMEVTRHDESQLLRCRTTAGEAAFPFDALLVALGRRARTHGYGLETLGIPLTPQGTIEVNDCLQTCYPHIYACGDVAGPYQFTHVGAHQAWYATVNALFGRWRRFRADYSAIPWCTFTDPEVARVGLNEQEAQARGTDYELTVYDLGELDRAITDGEAHGLVKVLTEPGRDRILGATIIGEHAGDLIIEFTSAMRNRIGLNRILGTIHVYPTLSEASKYAAGNWKKAHAPQRLLRWVERYHAWQRG